MSSKRAKKPRPKKETTCNQNSDSPTCSQRQIRMAENAELLKRAKQTSQNIVLSLLEVGVSEDYLANQIQFITPEHFNDVIIERSIAGICGYPLCDSVLKEELKNQTYIIRRNKVYDITERQQYCSDKCFEASELVMDQVPTTPLYLRSADIEIKNFRLVIPDKNKLKGRSGRLINISERLSKEDLNEFESLPHKSGGKEKVGRKEEEFLQLDSSASQESMSLDPSTDTSLTGDSSSNSKSESCCFGFSPSSNTVATSSDTTTSDLEASLVADTQKLSISESSEGSKSSLTLSESPTQRYDGKKLNKEKVNKHKEYTEPSLDSIYEIERVLREWMTFESLRMVLGDNYVTGMLEDLGLRFGMESVSKYIAVCQTLGGSEREERSTEDSKCAFNLMECTEEQQKLVSSNEQFRKMFKQSSSKVKAFLEGNEFISSNEDSLPTISEEGCENIVDVQRKNRMNETDTEGKQEVELDSVSLPLTDTHSQKTWRRRIVLEKLNKPISSYACDFGLEECEIRRLVTNLISTFDLSPHNILLSVRQWKFVALFLLKMLSVRYAPIEKGIVPGGRGHDFVTLTLREERLDPDYLNRLLSYVTEIHYILSKHHCGSTTHASDSSSAEPEPSQNPPPFDQSTLEVRRKGNSEQKSTNCEELD